ncbi:phage filamentation protein Fil family protein [Buttiauxella agrestis]
MEPSFASLLKRQSPSMSYGHGWIMGEEHPSRDQSALLNGLRTRKPSLVTRLIKHWRTQ